MANLVSVWGTPAFTSTLIVAAPQIITGNRLITLKTSIESLPQVANYGILWTCNYNLLNHCQATCHLSGRHLCIILKIFTEQQLICLPDFHSELMSKLQHQIVQCHVFDTVLPPHIQAGS